MQKNYNIVKHENGYVVIYDYKTFVFTTLDKAWMFIGKDMDATFEPKPVRKKRA